MSSDAIRLSLPAQPHFARSVRMLASTLAVANDFSVDDVEDVRMAAEEGFVYACATGIDACEISFSLGERSVSMDFPLGETPAAEGAAYTEVDEDIDLVELLLDAVCDEFAVLEAEAGSTLHLLKRAGHGE